MSTVVAIDRDRCMGSGNCAFWLSDVFALDDADIAVVVDPTAASAEQILSTARSCPTQAISVKVTEETSQSSTPTAASEEGPST